MYEVFIDGAVTTEFHNRSFLIRSSNSIGDRETVKALNKAEVKVSAKRTRQIMIDALIEGTAWVLEIESKCKAVLAEALRSRKAGTPISQETVGEQLKRVIMDGLEPIENADQLSDSLDTFAKRPKSPSQKAKDLTYWRNQRRGAREYAKQQKQLDDWKAGRKKKAAKKTGKDYEPVWRLKARQGATRMQTGWNRSHNEQTFASAMDNELVVYLQFTLGRANEHTDMCLSRAGMTMRKNDDRWTGNIPPLHFRCKSSLIQITKEMRKSLGVKVSVPRARKKNPPDSGFGG